jgi:release factor glutamine methyltransferase
MWDWIVEQSQRDNKLSWKDLQAVWQHYGPDEQALSQAVLRLIQGEPLAYIIGSAPFGPLSLAITPPLLIPRPETWDWIEQFLPTVSPINVLDLGCGPGTLGMALAYFHPHQASLTCVDLSVLALDQARRNLIEQPLIAQGYHHSNWYEGLEPENQFDLIMSNPPYCAAEEQGWVDADYEDRQALFGAFGGLEPYIQLFSRARSFLTADGIMVVEHGPGQGAAIVKLLLFYGGKHWRPWYDTIGSWRATSFSF